MSARASRAPAPRQHGKPGARHAGGALEIQDPERGTELPVRLRLEVKHRRRAPPADFDIVCGRLPHRHALVRQVRQHEQPRVAPLLDRASSASSSRMLAGARLVLRENPARIAAFALGLRHRLPRGVLYRASGFRRAESAGARSASRPVSSARVGRRIHPPRTQARFNVRQDVPGPAVGSITSLVLCRSRARRRLAGAYPLPAASLRWLESGFGLGLRVCVWRPRVGLAVRLSRPTSLLTRPESPLGFLGVVGDVPARPLELKRRRRHQLLDRSLAAGRTHLQRRIRELPNQLEPGPAGVALVFVEGHGRWRTEPQL